jgi:DNA-binding MarR family transcriptional regulator
MATVSTDGPSPAQAADELLVASRVLVAVAARSLAGIEHEVSVVQFRALVVLWEDEPRSLAALAGELDVHPSTATRLCDRLVAKGLVDRHVAEASRREVELRLTDDGRRLVARVTDQRRADLVRIARRLSAAERRALLSAFEAFDRAAAALVDHDTTVPWPT